MSSILVLDDRATERELLVTVLGYLGHTMREASDRQEALDRAREHAPDLIMVDVMMPAMNGSEFVRELRADGALRNTRVIFCTGSSDQAEVRELAESCGVTDILVKPYEPEAIIRVVGEALTANPGPPPQVVSEELDSEELRVLNAKLVQKLDELERSKRLVEAKAEQLAISLKYKPEFLANMSDKLRSPVNSVMVLAGLLRDNGDGNLTAKQIQYAGVISSSGADLLKLIDDMLDRADIEPGTVTAEIADVAEDTHLPAPPDSHAASALPTASRPAGIKVLVIDDDSRNILAFTALLERARFEVVSAVSGKDGLAILEQTPDIDIALVDIMMPVMDGYATIEAMRRVPGQGAMPILAVTAKVGGGEAERCVEVGASAYVSKPVDTADLLRLIGEWVPARPRLAAPAG
jgi:CheY-like chemotaxis protein